MKKYIINGDFEYKKELEDKLIKNNITSHIDEGVANSEDNIDGIVYITNINKDKNIDRYKFSVCTENCTKTTKQKCIFIVEEETINELIELINLYYETARNKLSIVLKSHATFSTKLKKIKNICLGIKGAIVFPERGLNEKKEDLDRLNNSNDILKICYNSGFEAINNCDLLFFDETYENKLRGTDKVSINIRDTEDIGNTSQPDLSLITIMNEIWNYQNYKFIESSNDTKNIIYTRKMFNSSVISMLSFLEYIGLSELYMVGLYFFKDVNIKENIYIDNTDINKGIIETNNVFGAFASCHYSKIIKNMRLYNVSNEGVTCSSIARIRFSDMFLKTKRLQRSKVCFEKYIEDTLGKKSENRVINSEIVSYLNIGYLTDYSKVEYDEIVKYYLIFVYEKDKLIREKIIEDNNNSFFKFLCKFYLIIKNYYFGMLPMKLEVINKMISNKNTITNDPVYLLINSCYNDIINKYNIDPRYLTIIYKLLDKNISVENFDVDFYRSAYKDIENKNNVEAKLHYIIYGINEQRLGKINMPNDFDVNEYRLINQDLNNLSDIELKIHYHKSGKKEKRIYKFILPQDFDIKMYKSLNPETQIMTDDEAKAHYHNTGVYENRSYKLKVPKDFDYDAYRLLNDDLEHMTEEELKIHYHIYGEKEKRKTKMNVPKDFNAKHYKILNNDLSSIREELLRLHYHYFGEKEKRIHKIELPEDFNCYDYRLLNNDLNELTDDELMLYHYYYGKAENREYKLNIPHDFNPDHYKILNPKLKLQSKNDLILHYHQTGSKQQLEYKLDVPDDFNPQEYKSLYKDLKKYSDNELTLHYHQKGKKENRIYKIVLPKDFDISVYKLLNKDASKLNDIEAKKHYCTHGIKENRPYKLDIPIGFDINKYREMNKDLKSLSDFEALLHYVNYGQKEYRNYKK